MGSTQWYLRTWDCTLQHSCVHWASRLTMDCSGVHLFTVKLLRTAFDKLFPHPTPHLPCSTSHPPTLFAMLAQNWCVPQKLTLNGLKPSKKHLELELYCIKFNRLLSPVLLNKVSLTQAKAGYTN